MPLVGDDLKNHKRRGTLGVLYHGDLFNVLVDPPVLLIVALLVLVKDIFIRKDHGHSGCHCLSSLSNAAALNHFRLLGGLFDEHAVRLAVKGVTNILFDLPADCRPVAAHVSGNLDVPLASITVDGLLVLTAAKTYRSRRPRIGRHGL